MVLVLLLPLSNTNSTLLECLRFFSIKGTVSVVSNDPQCKDGNA